MVAENSSLDESGRDCPNRPGARWIVCWWLVGTVVFAVLLAMDFERCGANRFLAILAGAATATATTTCPLAIYGAICRDIWKHQRGYPFLKGDIVVVTNGPLTGRQGKVMAVWQGEADFKVAFNDPGQECWLRAQELRKVS